MFQSLLLLISLSVPVSKGLVVKFFLHLLITVKISNKFIDQLTKIRYPSGKIKTYHIFRKAKRMSISQNLKALRLTNQLSQGEVARQIGVSRPAYGFWEKGTVKPKADKLEKLADLFHVRVSDLTKDAKIDLINLYDDLSTERQNNVLVYTKHQKHLQDQETNPLAAVTFIAHKVYEKLSAGTGYGYFDDGSYDIAYSDKAYDYDFASWVFGDSMTPEFENGSVALIRQTTFDLDGAVYAVEWDGQTYIKHVHRETTGLRLVSSNPDYPDQFAPFDEAPRIIGKIVGHFIPIEKED